MPWTWYSNVVQTQTKNWTQLLFYFFVLVNVVMPFLGMRVFFISGSCFKLNFPRNSVLRKRFNWIPKLTGARMDWLCSFLVGICPISSTSYLHGLKSGKIAQMCLAFDDIKSFRYLVWRVFWSVFYMCLYFLGIGSSNVDWWALSFRDNCTSYGRAFSILACSQLVIVLWHVWRDLVTWDLPVKTGCCACIYAASSSLRIHATTNNEARELRVTLPAGCCSSYLQLAGDCQRYDSSIACNFGYL